MTRRILFAGVLLLAGAACAQPAPLTPPEFSWRAPLAVAAGTSVARVVLPADALVRMQTSDARDLRVFNAAGQAVPFAFLPAPPPATPEPVRTKSYPALVLNAPPRASGSPPGTVQVRIDEGGRQRSVLVHMDGAVPAGAGNPSSALFATPGEQQLLTGITVQATLPANTPVRMYVSTSKDLAQWTSALVKGRLYKFEGAGAPANDTLEFHSPLSVEGRYLRLDWDSDAGVSVTSIAGVIAPATPASTRVPAELAAPVAAGKGALEITTGFSTPLAAIALSTAKPNTLLPVRILGRNDASQPWRPLTQTVVYRIVSSASEATNPPAPLYGASVRMLRIESTSGADLAVEQLRATAEFDAIGLVFVASGSGPFELAVGHAGAARAAVPLPTITTALGTRKLKDLPEAAVGAGSAKAEAATSAFGWAWNGGTPSKTTVLWAVLIAGVLMLAAVAWSLLRQLNAAKPPSA